LTPPTGAKTEVVIWPFVFAMTLVVLVMVLIQPLVTFLPQIVTGP